MSLPLSTALTRLTSGRKPVFNASWSQAQQIQRVNEVLDRFYEFGTWRGVNAPIALTSSAGIITLGATYQRLDKLKYANGVAGGDVPIKSQVWAFSECGPLMADWTAYWHTVAIDLGDNSSSQHQYQVTGPTADVDALTFTGLARKRFVWLVQTTELIVPESFQALRLGVLALDREDEGDTARYQELFFGKGGALDTLNGNLSEFDPEDRQIHVIPRFGGAPIQSLT